MDGARLGVDRDAEAAVEAEAGVQVLDDEGNLAEHGWLRHAGSLLVVMFGLVADGVGQVGARRGLPNLAPSPAPGQAAADVPCSSDDWLCPA